MAAITEISEMKFRRSLHLGMSHAKKSYNYIFTKVKIIKVKKVPFTSIKEGGKDLTPYPTQPGKYYYLELPLVSYISKEVLLLKWFLFFVFFCFCFVVVVVVPRGNLKLSVLYFQMILESDFYPLLQCIYFT